MAREGDRERERCLALITRVTLSIDTSLLLSSDSSFLTSAGGSIFILILLILVLLQPLTLGFALWQPFGSSILEISMSRFNQDGMESHEMDCITGGTADPQGPYGAATTVSFVMIFEDSIIKKNFLRRILLLFLLQVFICFILLNLINQVT